jgi:carbamoyltransferase|tara:strand:+ start:7315 stop:8691 length:1377 start_codon:yes stop_codon:yes gene_type:complete
MSKLIQGISEGYHDAGVSMIWNGEILSATHAERFSRKKNDRWTHPSQFPTNPNATADKTAFYEKPLLKRTRQLFAGQGLKKTTTKYDVSFHHHKSHAAAGFFTSKFDSCNILVIDAIGEWDTVSIWKAWTKNGVPRMMKTKSYKYPYSIGLFYSAITKAIGLKPQEDEYITMGMAAYGEPIYEDHLSQIMDFGNCHKGITDLLPRNCSNEDLAASAQQVVEDRIIGLVQDYCHHENLVMMGGVALNCVANTKVANLGKNIWIMPNPGDCGSSLGAAALAYGNKLNWVDPYLGTEIKRDINAKEVINHLIDHSYCGIANGRAEFGPRALGNRSLIADPRRDLKDTINKIKQRQRFRPFAPAILEEFADEYFEGPMNEYMQFVSKAKHDYKSVTHVDGTARVQVVKKNCKSIIRPILEEWYEQTGCPMLLNTSLNIKGQPMVDTWQHALDFEKEYDVKVF